ncbi:MAG: extracellular solute-binding protein [Spirochaetes bacterium]|uniref:Extracellular solute-binding protein n=1 Tax=Candidatus Ornithospirochaeta stercoravium TaxID=2840897 RepID=A0A9D9IB12_9SPIO|nr:extracellular solute-binding protein [Candidatus Ornithospirochaeta stercoravium]
MKKALTVFAVVLLSAAFLFAGGNAESDDGQISIIMMDSYAAEDPHGQYVYEYAEKFMEEHPNVTIEIQAVASNDIYTRLAAMATSPDELPTMFFTSADQIPTLYDLGLTEDLNNYMTDEDKALWTDGVIESGIINGDLTYIPVSLQPTDIIYRIDRFEEAGLEIPTTWDEFIECAKALTKDTDGDGVVDQWGFGMVGSNDSSGQSRFMSYLWSNGYECAYEEDGEWKTDIAATPEFIDVFSKWTSMNADGLVPIGITEVNYSTAANYFAMGYTSMFLTGPNALGVAYSSNPDLRGKLGSFKIPGEYSGTMLGAEGYAISSYASDAEKQAAYEFIKFFATADTEYKFWQSSGKIPAVKAGQSVEFITGEDYEGFLQQIADGCRPTLTFPGIAGLKGALGDAYSAVFSGEMTNEQAVDSLVADLAELMEDYN